MKFAWFVSPHGFGHAARSAAIMEAVYQLDCGTEFEIFTQTPQWFFKDSMSCGFGYHSVLTDIGLAQKTPLHEDLDKTLKILDEFLPFDTALIRNLARKIRSLKCDMAICDIAAMGIAAARYAEIPSVLIENFTWDWIYEQYLNQAPRIERHIRYLKDLYDSADYRIQTEPVCLYCQSDMTSSPVSRRVRTSSSFIRQGLGISDSIKAVLITMGGIEGKFGFSERLGRYSDVYFIIPGAGNSKEFRDNLILLPHHSEFYHPDLVNACDAAIGKVGYSTLAEAYHAGVPFGYVPRPSFRESGELTAFIEKTMNCIQITDTEFEDCLWLSRLPELLSMPKIRRNEPNGAEQIARSGIFKTACRSC